jgi:hypothetical protein
MAFWDNVFTPTTTGPAPQPTAPVAGRAWWQDAPEQVYQPQPGSYDSSGYPSQQFQQGPSQQQLQQIRKRGHEQISSEEAEAIAEYDLATKAKYQAVCDQCGSGNFILAGTRVAGVVMPTNKCFNCGNSARSPEPAVGGGSGSGSIHTRQIDTGGAGGSMFMRFTGIPRSYAPRA